MPSMWPMRSSMRTILVPSSSITVRWVWRRQWVRPLAIGIQHSPVAGAASSGAETALRPPGEIAVLLAVAGGLDATC